MAVFFLQAFAGSGVFARLAEIQTGMHASAAALGLALLGGDVGTFLTLPYAGRLVENIGTRRALLYGVPVVALSGALSALAWHPAVFFVTAILAGASFTITNIAMNVEADRVEAATGRRILNRCHGVWSLGFVSASLVATGATALHVSPSVHLFAVLPVAIIAAMLIVGPLAESPPRPQSGAPARRFALPSRATLLLIAFMLSSIWLEAGSRTWSVIFTRDVFHPAEWVATLTLPIAIGGAVAGRLFADRWIERFGPVRVAAVLSAVSFIGLVLVVLGLSIPLTFAGFALVGIGVSSSFPQAVSAAARLGDRPASENVAALALAQAVVLVLTPPIMGLSASQWGIQVSFGLILPFPILAVLLARNLGEARKSADS
ncbi:MAG TPA: MFS transporter [Bauldia sp.]|nr:MFS transporter [Bauldia sp.]